MILFGRTHRSMCMGLHVITVQVLWYRALISAVL